MNTVSIFNFLTLRWLRLYTGPELIAGLAALGGTALQYNAAEAARSNASDATNAALMQMGKKTQAQADLLTNKAPEIYDPKTLIPQRQQTDTALTSDLSEYLNSAKYTPKETAGNTGTDWLKAKAENTLAETQRTADLNRLWARLYAPSQVDLARSLQGSKLLGDLNDLGSDRAASGGWNQLAISQASQPNAEQLLAGNILATGGTTVLGKQLAQERKT